MLCLLNKEGPWAGFVSLVYLSRCLGDRFLNLWLVCLTHFVCTVGYSSWMTDDRSIKEDGQILRQYICMYIFQHSQTSLQMFLCHSDELCDCMILLNDMTDTERNELAMPRERTGSLQLFGSNDPRIDSTPYGNRSLWPLGQGAGGAPIPCANTAGVGPIKVGEKTLPKLISFVKINKWGVVTWNICKRRTEAKIGIPLGGFPALASSNSTRRACVAKLMRLRDPEIGRLAVGSHCIYISSSPPLADCHLAQFNNGSYTPMHHTK